MAERMLVAMVGPPGCGKSTAADHLVEALGFSYVSASEVLRIIAFGSGVDATQFEPLHSFAGEFRERQGRGALTEIALRILETRRWKSAVIDGIRSADALSVIRQFCAKNEWQFVSIGLLIDERTALERLEGRARERDPRIQEEIKKYFSEQNSIARLAIESCDKVISNNCDVGDFLDQLTQEIAASRM